MGAQRDSQIIKVTEMRIEYRDTECIQAQVIYDKRAHK